MGKLTLGMVPRLGGEASGQISEMSKSEERRRYAIRIVCFCFVLFCLCVVYRRTGSKCKLFPYGVEQKYCGLCSKIYTNLYRLCRRNYAEKTLARYKGLTLGCRNSVGKKYSETPNA